ncbi:MAG TPA: hypothetical protein VF169_03180 [Albitalea sp.]|uniref:hypothetical protein n=1 Tax=Piscinibacter sp. TaxID=1903157 RepID=UPI002ED1F894
MRRLSPIALVVAVMGLAAPLTGIAADMPDYAIEGSQGQERETRPADGAASAPCDHRLNEGNDPQRDAKCRAPRFRIKLPAEIL